jgi:hypothetical protein
MMLSTVMLMNKSLKASLISKSVCLLKFSFVSSYYLNTLLAFWVKMLT